MRKRQVSLIVLLIISSISMICILSFISIRFDSTEFEHNWIWGGNDDDEGYCIAVDNDNNIYLAGMTKSFGAASADAFLVKYDVTGHLLWNRTWGWSASEEARGIAIDNNKNCYVVGNSFLVKYNETGYQVWVRNLSANCKDIAMDGNNTIYLVGDLSEDLFLMKYNASGYQLWNKTWGSPLLEQGYAVGVDHNNYCYITGSILNFGSIDVVLVKFNTSGYQIWNQTWIGSNSIGLDLAIDSSNNCYITGYSTSYVAILVKFDEAGNLLWNRTWGTINPEIGYGIAIDSNDNCYITGFTYGFSSGGADLFLAKYDSTGNQLWVHTWGGSGYEEGRSIAIDGNNNVFLTGCVETLGIFNRDALLLKFNIETLELELGMNLAFNLILIGLFALIVIMLLLLLLEQVNHFNVIKVKK